jgi:hypothetical protein
MAKGPMYVKDFNFSSAGKTVGLCNDGMTKMASGGYYSKGGMKEPATGEKYPSRRAMMKHESMETPRMQREEVMQSRMVKTPPAPMRRQMPVAPTAPMIQPGGMKKGGFVKGGTGMVKTEGTLGIKGNKNPGEKNGKPTTATKAGNVPFKKGGEVKKYAVGGKAAPTQTGALNQMAAQQSSAPVRRSRDGSPLMPQRAKPPMPQPQQRPPQGMDTAPQAANGLQPGQQQNQQQFQQMMAQMVAARAAGQAPQGQLFGQMSPQGQQQSMSQMPPEMAAMVRQYAQQGLGQPLGGQQAMGGQPLGPAPAGATPPPGYGFGNPQNAPQQAMPTQQGMQQQAPMGMGQSLGGQRIGQFSATPPQGYGPQQQAPMGAGMGKFGSPSPATQQNAQTAINQLYGGTGGR